MSDPRRLIEDARGLEAQLLEAGRRDAISPHSAATIAGALNVAPPGTVAPAPAVGAKLATSKALLTWSSVAVAGALSAWAVFQAVQGAGPARAPGETRALVPTAAVSSVPLTPSPDVAAPAVAAVAPKASVSVRPPPVSEADTLPRELEALDRARAALRRGDATRALALLDDYATRFPKPHLRVESRVLRIEALVLRGQNDTAVRLGKEFLAREPNGPYARRVRSLIEKAGASTPR